MMMTLLAALAALGLVALVALAAGVLIKSTHLQCRGPHISALIQGTDSRVSENSSCSVSSVHGGNSSQQAAAQRQGSNTPAFQFSIQNC